MEITAIWDDKFDIFGKNLSVVIDTQGRRIGYKHPFPFTIKSLTIVNVCPQHDALRFAPTGKNPFDNEGYLKLPIANPTEAEALYVNLWGITPMNARYAACGKDPCVVAQFDDGFGNVTNVQHPHHTKRCKYHLDDSDHSILFAEAALLKDTQEALKQDPITGIDVIDPETMEIRREFNPLTKPEFYFDENRSLHIKLNGVQPSHKASLSTSLTSKQGNLIFD